MGGSQEGDDLFGVNDSDEFFVAIDDGEGAEIVFVEELGYFAAVGVDAAGNEVTLRQAGQRHLGLGKQDSDDGDETGDSLLFVEEVDVGDGFDVAFEVAQRVDGLIDDAGGGQGDVFGGHAAGGGVSGEFEKIFD